MRHLCSQVINVRAVVVVTLWELDLQLPMQLVPITANVVSSTPAHGKVYSIQCYVIKFVRDLWFSPGTPVSAINNTDRGVPDENHRPAAIH
jgi:hypothetical protein